jgi:N-acetylglucosaminyl-diphospho-decaprenol L-rhamnosyltransferase
LQYSGGANFGLKTAFENGATHVLFLSNDTRIDDFEPLSLRDLEEVCPSQLVLWAPRIEKRETGEIHSLGGEVHLESGTLKHLVRIESFIKNSFYVPGAAFAVTRGAWESLGGFDIQLGSYWEDVDLSLRAQRLGVEFKLLPGLVIKHGIGKTCGNEPLYSVYYYHRNRKTVSLRHGTTKQQIKFLPRYLASTLRKLFKYLKNKDLVRVKLLLRALVS